METNNQEKFLLIHKIAIASTYISSIIFAALVISKLMGVELSFERLASQVGLGFLLLFWTAEMIRVHNDQPRCWKHFGYFMFPLIVQFIFMAIYYILVIKW